MNIEPLPTTIRNRAIALGITAIHLHFNGGNDEGNLDIQFKGGDSRELEQAVDDWVWKTYDYSGAGDGTDYGDDITYDLETMRVTQNSWCMERKDDVEHKQALVLVDDAGNVVTTPTPEAVPYDTAVSKLDELRAALFTNDKAKASALLDEVRGLLPKV